MSIGNGLPASLGPENLEMRLDRLAPGIGELCWDCVRAAGKSIHQPGVTAEVLSKDPSVVGQLITHGAGHITVREMFYDDRPLDTP